MNKLLLIKKLHLEKSRRKFQFKASSHYTQRYIIIQCIDKIETCLSKLKFNKPLENDEVGALALITEAKKIIDDFYANSEYIDSNNVCVVCRLEP